ncbi:GTA head formation protein, RCAP_rcc01685 family [Ostreiculturibacter nitratireducens]|uniref:GTA head formation protein, RCAP_rcc01685 family n=1 Tax=Ostreiculturibacter nitratireducens TaxID=3075226 RepID=UPI0031B5C4AA
MSARGGGSRYLKEPFDCSHAQRFEATERVMELQFDVVSQRLQRMESLMEGLEKRLWMTVYGVVGVILTQAVQSVLEYAPR